MRDKSVNCPFCVERGKGQDTTRNLHVAPGASTYHCFRCGARPRETGKLPDAILGITGISASYINDEYIRKDTAGEITREHKIKDCSDCQEYLAGRGYDPDLVGKQSWLSGGWFMGHRIFFRNEGLKWWQGRAISPRNSVRYMTTPDFGAPAILPFGGVGNSVLVEGPFDALRLWSAGIRAIALVGVSFGEGKLALVQKELWHDRKVILCLDKENTEHERRQWTWHLSKFIAVKQWDLKAADPDTMDVAELRALSNEAGGD